MLSSCQYGCVGSRTCIVKMRSFDMPPVVKGCDGNVRESQLKSSDT